MEEISLDEAKKFIENNVIGNDEIESKLFWGKPIRIKDWITKNYFEIVLLKQGIIETERHPHNVDNNGNVWRVHHKFADVLVDNTHKVRLTYSESGFRECDLQATEFDPIY